MTESTRQLMDECYRLFNAYDEIRPYLSPSIKAYFQMSRRAIIELDRTTCAMHLDYTTCERNMCGLPVKIDMRHDAKDVLLIWEVSYD